MFTLENMNTAFAPKFTLLPQELQDEIIARAGEVGAYKAGQEYAERAGMNPISLYERLKKLVKKEESWGGEFLPNGEKKTLRTKVKGEVKEKSLSKEEKEFLKKLGTGEVSFDETSRFVAVRVFERMLKNPEKWQYLDFFRTELIKVKREEAEMKDEWAKEIIGRMFAGKLPPRNCVKCGHDWTKEEPIEGEVVSNGQKSSLTTGI